MGNIDPVNVIANVATGGLYGVGQGAVKAIETGKVGAGAADALASYGMLGSVLQPTVGTQNSLGIQSLIAGGALGAAGGIGAGGFGTAGMGPAGSGVLAPTAAPFYAGDPYLASLGAYDAAAPAGYGTVLAPGAGAGSAAGTGINTAGALMGAQTAQQGVQLANKLMQGPGPGGASPLSFPGGGGGGGISPQQAAMLSAQQSAPHEGLAPRFEQRIQGKQESPGLSSLSMIPQYYQP